MVLYKSTPIEFTAEPHLMRMVDVFVNFHSLSCTHLLPLAVGCCCSCSLFFLFFVFFFFWLLLLLLFFSPGLGMMHIINTHTHARAHARTYTQRESRQTNTNKQSVNVAQRTCVRGIDRSPAGLVIRACRRRVARAHSVASHTKHHAKQIGANERTVYICSRERASLWFGVLHACMHACVIQYIACNVVGRPPPMVRVVVHLHCSIGYVAGRGRM
mmetsp:Transcript_14538/g.27562  ORF Transcript_14538/g.27562 Transcript_14538/m.27562 type:complete len:215 (-) Transcript_14538:19-663(-)